MEIAIGMILLLQVLASIQLMLVYRQVLQQIKKQSEKMEAILESLPDRIREKEKKARESNFERMEDSALEQRTGETGNATKERGVQEALINEVLSEVFS